MMRRRQFIQRLLSAGTALAAFGAGRPIAEGISAAQMPGVGECLGARPAFSIIPVVGDGNWIWNRPPEGQTGYLESRSYQVKVGISIQGTGRATQIQATTPVPVSFPEQTIEDVRIETQGCTAGIRELDSGAGQLGLAAPGIEAGQLVAATATFRLKISKQYHGFEKDQFSPDQQVPSEIRKKFLQNSPGVETSSREVQDLVKKLASTKEHPWDQAKRFAEWSQEHIRAKLGSYTSVVAAIRDGVGDCEERSAVFVALCRAVGIPARIVWIPNHNWSEFFLSDEQGTGHWIPVHTACYPWFGWVGAHELILQKGDRVYVPERRKQFRLLDDWARWLGAAPKTHWQGELTPLANELEGDPGPGARRKDSKGEWVVTGSHPYDRYMRR